MADSHNPASKSPWSATFVPGVMLNSESQEWEVYNYVGDVDTPTLFAGTPVACEAFISGLSFAKKTGWAA